MTWFIQIWQKFAPVFTTYVLPFFGLFLISYTIYLVRFIIFGKEHGDNVSID